MLSANFRQHGSHTLKWADRIHSLRAVGAKPAVRPTSDSVEHWFKEHSWGYGTSRRGKLIRYEVNHPEWDVYPVREFTHDVDWALMATDAVKTSMIKTSAHLRS